MKIWQLVSVFFLRDYRCSLRTPARWLEAPVFFLLLCLLFPLSLTPDSEQLRHLAPGLIWMGLLLSNLLSLNVLWAEEFKHGVFEQMILSPRPLLPMMLGKLLAQWAILMLPMMILLPFTVLILQLPFSILPAVFVATFLGTWVMTGLGAMGVVLLLGLPQGGVLLALLVFPWYLPVLIFGINLISSALLGVSMMGPILLLVGLFFLVLGLAPLGVSAAVRLCVNR